MAHLDCQAFFNFLADEDAGRLRLNACAGIPEGEVRKIEWLDYGVAVCGCVARDGFPILAQNIFNVPDPRTELVKSYGIQAYACHPLKIGDRLIGTLSFGTRTRTSFSSEDLSLMKTVADQVATAMERMRLIKELRRSRDELEKGVQDRTEELTKSQNRLQQLSSQLLLAQEKERKRVAIELHDGLLSELAATKYLLEGKIMLLEKGKLSEPGEFRRVVDILASAMKEARRIMNNLHPSVLDEFGLITALNWLSGEYHKSYPHIVVLKKMEVGERDIPDSLKVVIYRVLQEALNNFAKHGKGDRIELSLSKSDNILTLRIQDNGQGFDVEKVQKGLGLESMRERVELSGGEFQIESAIGQGTTIRAIWRI
jgi:signal transduction histidine kinase